MDKSRYHQSLLLPSRLIFNSKYPGITDSIQRGFNTYVGKKLAQSPGFKILYEHTEGVRSRAKILIQSGINTFLSRIIADPDKKKTADEIRADIDRFIKRLLPLDKK